MHHDLIVISQNYHVIHHKQYYDIIGWIRRWNTSTALNITTVALGGAQLNFPRESGWPGRARPHWRTVTVTQLPGQWRHWHSVTCHSVTVCTGSRGCGLTHSLERRFDVLLVFTWMIARVISSSCIILVWDTMVPGRAEPLLKKTVESRTVLRNFETDAYHLEPCANWYHTSSSTMISFFISHQWYHRYDMHHDLIVIS